MKRVLFVIAFLMVGGCRPSRYIDLPPRYTTETTVGRDSVTTITLYRTDGRDERIESVRLGRVSGEAEADSMMLRFYRLALTYVQERGLE